MIFEGFYENFKEALTNDCTRTYGSRCASRILRQLYLEKGCRPKHRSIGYLRAPPEIANVLINNITN